MSGHGPGTPSTPAVSALRAQLSAYCAADESELAAVNETLQWLASSPSPFDQDAAAVHVTASAIVVDSLAVTCVLLHHHKRLATWLQPGGHIDDGESPDVAAVRETWEETGIVARHPLIQPTLIHVDAHAGPRGHRHLDLRYLLLADGRPQAAPREGESPLVRWSSVDAALNDPDTSLAAAIRAAQRACAVLTQERQNRRG